MANTFYLESKKKYDGRYLYVDFEQIPSISDNESKILWTLYSAGGKDNYYGVGPTTLTIDGKQAYYCERKAWDSYEFPAKKGSVSGEVTIQHDIYGDKTVVITLSTAIYNGAWDVPNNTITASWVLDKITRNAIITSAEDFDDEGTPSFTFIPAGLGIVSAWLEIENKERLCVRDNIENSGLFSWDLSSDEVDQLLSKCDKNSCKVKYVIKTTIDGVEYYDDMEKTMKVVNASPVISNASVVESNNAVLDVVGKSNVFVKNKSIVVASADIELKKSATLKSYTVTEGSSLVSETPGTFTELTDGVFLFYVQDSRENDASVEIERRIIPYVDLSCTVDKASALPDPTDENENEGKISVHCSGDFYDDYIGDTRNVLKVKCFYRVKGIQTWTDGGDMIITFAENSKYKAECRLTVTDYHETYEVQPRAVDAFGTVDSAIRTVKAVPIYDYNQDDLNFNVPVTGISFNTKTFEKIIDSTKEIRFSGRLCIIYAIGLDGVGSGVFVRFENEIVELISCTHVTDVHMENGVLSISADDVGVDIIIHSII